MNEKWFLNDVSQIEKKLKTNAVPKISPSFSGFTINSCTKVAVNPNCMIGAKKATIDDA